MTSVRREAANSQMNHHVAKPSATAGERTRDNFNAYFPLALHNMLASRKVLLIFSGADRLYWEFEDKYMKNYTQEFQKVSKNMDIHVIQNANHILSFSAWQDEMLDKLSSTLKSIDACG